MNFENYSVLMSVYAKENAKWFKQSIDSMMNQTIKTNDFVLIKDGKLTEKLEEIISEYETKYPDIFHVISLPENVGLGLALREGINNCQNELIARMDSDDIAKKDRCEKQLLKFKENTTLTIVGSHIGEFIDTIDNIQAYRLLPETQEEIKLYAKKRNPFGHPSVMFKKSAVLAAGNYRSYYLCEDYDLWIRMIENGAICYNIQEPLVYMRIGQDFYQRRGGIKYLKSILKFKTEQYHKGFYTLGDYFISSGAHIIICLMPNKCRDLFYKKILRKSENG